MRVAHRAAMVFRGSRGLLSVNVWLALETDEGDRSPVSASYLSLKCKEGFDAADC